MSLFDTQDTASPALEPDTLCAQVAAGCFGHEVQLETDAMIMTQVSLGGGHRWSRNSSTPTIETIVRTAQCTGEQPAPAHAQEAAHLTGNKRPVVNDAEETEIPPSQRLRLDEDSPSDDDDGGRTLDWNDPDQDRFSEAFVDPFYMEAYAFMAEDDSFECCREPGPFGAVLLPVTACVYSRAPCWRAAQPSPSPWCWWCAPTAASATYPRDPHHTHAGKGTGLPGS